MSVPPLEPLTVPPTVRRILGVYDADGGLRGEVAYVVGHVLGRTECSLCDITHSPLRRKREWDAWVASSTRGQPWSFDVRHRNEVSPPVVEIVKDRLPAVVAETVGGTFVVLLDGDQLKPLSGSVSAFALRLQQAVDAFDREPGAPSASAAPDGQH